VGEANRQLDAEDVKATVRGERFLELARELGGQPRKAGSSWRCPCFLHGGDGPNLVLSPEVGLWHCLSSCGGGDAIAMVMRARSLDFLGALAWLAEWAGVQGTGERRERARRTWATAPRVEPESLEARAFLASLWALVADAPWSGPAAEWLAETRGIEPDAAYALGCRDWSSVRAELAELFETTDRGVLAEVGLARDGRLHAAVAGVLSGVPAWRSVAVPVWRIGAAFPERWRWRYLSAPDGRPKSDSPFGGGVPADLLGLGGPERAEGARVRISQLGEPGARLLVIAEGEPDWWSATEAVDGRAIVLAVCGSPKAWRSTWPSWHDLAALGVQRVAVLVHHGERGADGRGHGELFAESVAVACATAGLGGRAVIRKLPAEGRDLNNLHQAGELAAWFSDVLEEVA